MGSCRAVCVSGIGGGAVRRSPFLGGRGGGSQNLTPRIGGGNQSDREWGGYLVGRLLAAAWGSILRAARCCELERTLAEQQRKTASVFAALG